MVNSTLIPTSGGDTITLDDCFNYKLYIPKKRLKPKLTSKGSFTEISSPIFLDGMGYVEWTMDITTGDKAREILAAYRVEDTWTFTGAYGESYLIYFDELDLNRYKTWWKASGKFRVLCTITELDICPPE